MPQYRHETRAPAGREATWAWHEREGAFRRLMPPWETVEEISADGGLAAGARRVFRIRLGPLGVTWIAKHTHCTPGESFTDVMVKGPFARWEHVHRFLEVDGGTLVRDEVAYELPLGAPGRLLGGAHARTNIRRMFRARELRLVRDLERQISWANVPRRRILISGAGGLIGRQLSAFLDTGGHEVWHLVRRKPATGAREIPWDPAAGELDGSQLEGFHAVIHLAGAGIADGRWTAARRKIIRDSRVDSTALIAGALARLGRPPGVFLAASAVGLYGQRGDEVLTEVSRPGTGFLPDVCREWEAAAAPARDAGIRTLHLRTGIVVAAAGGALARMLFPFRMGAGGPVGSGQQWMPWISLDDEVYAIHHLLMNDTCEGAYNLTAPLPVRQKLFAQTLARVLRRPAVMPLPGFVVRALFGAMGSALLLEGQRVEPARLTESGFRFTHAELESALRDELGRWAPPEISS